MDLPSDGVSKLTLLHNILHTLDPVRTQEQQWIHLEMITAILPRLFDDEWNAEMKQVIVNLNHNEIIDKLVITSDTTLNHTRTIAMFITALLLAVPGVEIGYFALGDNLTRITSIVQELLATLIDASRINVHAQESLILQFPEFGEISRLAAVRQTPRGNHILPIMIFDEIEPEIFTTAFCGLCAYDNYSLILLTRPSESMKTTLTLTNEFNLYRIINNNTTTDPHSPTTPTNNTSVTMTQENIIVNINNETAVSVL